METNDLGYFISVYEKFAQAENKSGRTIETVTGAVRKFDSFLGGNTNPQDITADDLRRYILHLQERCKWSDHPTIKQNHGNLSPDAIASYIRSIRSFWSWLEREKFIDHNPCGQVKPPKVPVKIVDPLTPGEVTQLIKVIPRKYHQGYRESCIILTLYGTGLRISELLNLKLHDVDFESGQLRVMGKGAKERSVYMSPKVYKGMFKYYSRWRPKVTSDYLFVHDDGRKLSRFYVEHRIHLYVSKAGIIKHCTPHVLRYSYSIQFLRDGGDPFTLQKILGHATLDMTRRYVQIANSDVEKQMKSFSPAEQLDVKF